MKNLNYSDFCEWLDENYEKVENILEYDDWSVVKIDGCYYYYDHVQEGSSDTVVEVKPITTLRYNISHDVQIDNLYEVFNCLVCGEQITSKEIIYWWFEEVKQ